MGALNLPALFKDAEPHALKFGVVGWPLSHTLSPAMHAAAIRALNIDAVYKAVPVSPEEWDHFLTQAKTLPLAGFNVTIPYKEAILKKGGHPVPWDDADCRGLGAANTVSRVKPGWKAFNTDVGGLQDDLEAQGVAFKGRNAVLLGSGGAARAAVAALAALADPPANVWILNRTLARAQELARQFSGGPVKVHAAPLDEGATVLKEASLLVNATSAGLAPEDPSPIDPRRLHERLLVYDMIYHRETMLMKAARGAGARAVGGLGMLVHQGARSFEIWFNRKPPIDVMRKAAEEELKRRPTT